jgi:hypothetical protein
MIDLTEKRYTQSWLGVKVRAHRIVLQFAIISTLIYFFGWMALLLSFFAFLCEVIPYNRFDKLFNPWLKKECDKTTLEELDEWVHKIAPKGLEASVTDPEGTAIQLIRELNAHVFEYMGQIHQITIDLCERAEIDLANERSNISRDQIGSLRYEVESVIEIIDPKNEHDLTILERLSRALAIWDDDTLWKNKWSANFN